MADGKKIISWVKLKNETYMAGNKRISYQNDPRDSANFWKGKNLGTNWGITPKSYYNYFSKEPTESIMKNMPIDTAALIYMKNYWNGKNFNLVNNDSIAYQFFDHYIHKGNINYLKNVLKFKYNFFEPNVSTSLTLNEVNNINKLDSEDFYKDIQNARVRAYKENSIDKPDFKLRPFRVSYEKKKSKPKPTPKPSGSVWDWLSTSFNNKKFKI